MNRLIAVGVVVLGLLGAVVLAESLPAVDQTDRAAAAQQAPVTSARVVCVESPAPQGETSLAALSLPGLELPPLGDTPTAPVMATPLDPAQSPTLLVEARGEVGAIDVPVDPGTSYDVTATGALAPGLMAEQRTIAAGGSVTGQSTQRCAVPTQQSWFVAGAGRVGERAPLVIVNPFATPAVVDISVFAETGEASASSVKNLGIAADGSIVVDLDAVAAGSERLAARVQATQGQVSAGLMIREVKGVDPGGLAWVHPTRSPARRVVTSAFPGVGNRVLRVVNPGEFDTSVQITALTPSGPREIGEPVSVASGLVVDVPLGETLGEEPAALVLQADQPVAATVRVSLAEGLVDLGYAPAVQPLVAPTATIMEPGEPIRLVLAGPGSAGGQLRWEVFDDSGQAVDSGITSVPAGIAKEIQIPAAGGRNSGRHTVVLTPDRPGEVVASRAIIDTIRVPNPTGQGKRRATLLDLLPLTEVPVEVTVPGVTSDPRTGLPSAG